MCEIQSGSGTVSYDAVRKAMDGKPYTMSLTDANEVKAVVEAVNQGIDSHIEACYCPGRGDRFEGGRRMDEWRDGEGTSYTTEHITYFFECRGDEAAERVRSRLREFGLTPETWGPQFVPVESAKQG
jgi:hypothetical protein